MSRVAQRHTAEERREEILAVAEDLFADRGLYGTSTEEIARRAGISQPYLFRLFGTKKELFIASVQRCLDQTLEMFQDASTGLTGEQALKAMGRAYRDAILNDSAKLQHQLQAYAACDDPQVRDVVRRGYGRLVEHVESASGASKERVSAFFATGMLMNVITSMQLRTSKQPWALRLIEGSGGGK